MAVNIPKSGKIIPLNIVMTYPVRWNRYRIYRDFVQNFYDSVDAKDWEEKFHYRYDPQKRTLTMEIEGVEFSYEWLLHIGASTKTANSGKYAGYFGEGFKIASLCAVREYKLIVEMYSGEWKLNVTVLDQKIDNQTVKMLAYKINLHENIGGSKLVLSKFYESDYEIFQTVLESFYYPENPAFGEKIWEGEEGAIYRRSRKPINPDLPYVSDYGRKGAVFCGYQMLGTSPFDLVICLHHYNKEDRERKTLYSFEIIKVFYTLSYYLDAQSAMFMLVKMRRYWNTYQHDKYGLHSWSPTIDRLIYKVSQSLECTEQFRRDYPNLLCVERIHSIHAQNQRSQAKSWLKSQDTKYLLVKDTFKQLNYPTLEQKCAESCGFVFDDRVSDKIENECFRILEEITQKIYEGFIIISKWPERRLITNERAIYHGMALTFKKRKHLMNNVGLKIRYDIRKIYLKKSIFRRDRYYDALSTYIHELCHIFGGDSSHSFSSGLSHAMEILLNHSSEIAAGKEQWERLFES